MGQLVGGDACPQPLFPTRIRKFVLFLQYLIPPFLYRPEISSGILRETTIHCLKFLLYSQGKEISEILHESLNIEMMHNKLVQSQTRAFSDLV